MNVINVLIPGAPNSWGKYDQKDENKPRNHLKPCMCSKQLSLDVVVNQGLLTCSLMSFELNMMFNSSCCYDIFFRWKFEVRELSSHAA